MGRRETVSFIKRLTNSEHRKELIMLSEHLCEGMRKEVSLRTVIPKNIFLLGVEVT